MSSKTIVRNVQIQDISPDLAWETWTPSSDEPWNTARISLFFRRAGLGVRANELESANKLTPLQLFDSLEKPDQTDKIEAFEKESTIILKGVLSSGSVSKLSAWWLHRLLHSPTPLKEKMVLFWHGHFATGAEKVADAELMWQQNDLLRTHALGDFREMVRGVSKDPAMLIYLDSVSNRKARANENYARELMELFCLGEGNYTEKDVQELARCFTGWEIRRKQFRFNPYQHDDGPKTILGKQGIRSGDEAIDQVLSQSTMPIFIVRKLVRFLVMDEPEVPDEFLTPLCKTFVDSQYSIVALVRQILTSRLLLSLWANGKKIRSPTEVAIQCMRSFQATTNLEILSERLKSVGQGLFFPPNVKGWDGGRAWINSSTLIARANLLHELVRAEATRFGGESFPAWCERNGIRSAEALVDYMQRTLLAQPLSETSRAELLTKAKDKSAWHRMVSDIGAMPLFQLA